MKLDISKQVIRGRFTRKDGSVADEFVIVNERQSTLEFYRCNT